VLQQRRRRGRTPATAAVALTARRVRESRGRARVGRRREELGVGFIEEREGEGGWGISWRYQWRQFLPRHQWRGVMGRRNGSIEAPLLEWWTDGAGFRSWGLWCSGSWRGRHRALAARSLARCSGAVGSWRGEGASGSCGAARLLARVARLCSTASWARGRGARGHASSWRLGQGSREREGRGRERERREEGGGGWTRKQAATARLGQPGRRATNGPLGLG
jgi:hypothetical protein